MTESFATPDDFGDLHASELSSSLGESLGAQAGEAFMGGSRTVVRGAEYSGAQRGVPQFNAAGAGMGEGAGFVSSDLTTVPAVPDVPIADAKARVKQEGLEGELKLPDQDTIRGPVLDMMVQDAHERQQYAAAVNRGPQNFAAGALGFGTSIAAGMIDPVNIAAFSIPVIGEAKYGMMLARAGDSVAARAALRTGVGATQGFVGGAALVPADWWLHTQDGQDYTFADALKSVVLSAGMGAAAHGGFGAIGDVVSRVRGRPLSGSIEDMRARALAGDTHAADIVEQLGKTGVHLPEDAFAPGGVDTDQVPGISSGLANIDQPITSPVHPAEVLADLPPGAREDVTRAAIAGVISGEPVRVGEMLQEAGKVDPRIAESIEAWHGSQHDFDQFDSGKIGTGEGAQSYGHGLYFAEKDAVAQQYFDRLSRDNYEIPPEGQAKYGERLASIKAEYEQAVNELADAANKGTDAGEIQQRIGGITHQWEALLEDARDEFPAGGLYKVRIHANPEHFLDYDKPLNEQSEHVKKAIAGLGNNIKVGWLPTHANDMAQIRKEMLAEAKDGGEFYSRLGRGIVGDKGIDAGKHQVAASAVLKEAGIPGIKYLDQSSRPANKLDAPIPPYIVDALRKLDFLGFDRPGQALAALRADIRDGKDIRETWDLARPEDAEAVKVVEDYARRPMVEEPENKTRNYVVFDDKLIRITHKNGKEVGLDEMKAGQGGEPGLPKIDNSHDVVSGANSAKDLNGPVYVDKHIPQFSPTLKDRDGNPANLHKYLAIHETEEAKAEAGGMPYLKAHTDVATPAERAAVEADGVSWKGYTDEIDGYLSKIEHEKATNPPTEPLHVDPQSAIGHHHSENKQAPAGAGPALPVEAEKAAQPPTAREDARSPPLAGELEGGRAAGDNVVPLRQRPDWQKLRDRAPSADDNDLAAASRDAEKSPEVTSTEPAKAVSAAQAEAEKANKLLADLLPKLTDAERKTFEDALSQLDDDQKAREQIVRDGAACLAEAAA